MFPLFYFIDETESFWDNPWKFRIFFIYLQPIQSVRHVWAVGSRSYWTSASPLSHTGVLATRLPQTEYKRTFSNVIFCVQISQSLFLSEGIATRRSRRVYYICMPESRSRFRLSAAYTYYNTRWRGLTELLILREGNARACTWDKRQMFHSHVFSFPILYY